MVVYCGCGDISRALYGGYNWTMKTEDKTRITVAEMEFMRRTG
jgi:hypothetical protein